jgi:hypothetical protein
VYPGPVIESFRRHVAEGIGRRSREDARVEIELARPNLAKDCRLCRSAFGRWVLPGARNAAALAVKLIGVPDCALKMPDICHPPKIARINFGLLLANGMSQTKVALYI